MSNRQRVGGIAALVAAATFVFGIVMFVTVLSDYTTGDPDPGESVAFLVDNQAALYVWNVVILIVFGVVLVPVVLALHERLTPDSPELANTATVFGLVWAGLVIAAGMVAGAAGLVTVVPALEDVGALFGLGLIVWFVWVGVILIGDTDQRMATDN